MDGAGNGEFSVALRTGVFDGEVGWVYAGCGIVEGSVADDEYDEIGMKLKTVLSAFDGGEVPSACQPTERVDFLRGAPRPRHRPQLGHCGNPR